MIVAIDGLSGTGKSSCADALEARLDGWFHMDTGSMFRTVALGLLEAGADVDDPAAVAAALDTIPIEIKDGGLLLDGRDVSDLIRSSAVDAASSKIAVYPSVRAKVLECERVLGDCGNWVVDGRDIGTVVFPDAVAKFFLTASVEEKARRRSEQNRLRGGETDISVLIREMKERDKRDEGREAAPCVAADDAVVIDTDGLTLSEVVEIMLSHLKATGIV